MLRILGQHCGSTALAFSMHTHQVAIPAWRWKVQKAAPVEPLLKRIAAERIFLLSSGGSDWIGGSGKAEKVDGGYKHHRAKGVCLRLAGCEPLHDHRRAGGRRRAVRRCCISACR